MSDKKYWTSFAALNNKEEIEKREHDEFKEELPFEDINDKGLFDAKHPRRDFLKYLGFSTAAAAVAAGCETPVRKAVPLVNRPEGTYPGVPKLYATTYVQDGDVVPVVVKTRDGRPIKVEGNPEYPFTLGGTSPRVQASVLDLYDMYRIPHPKQNVAGKGWQEIPSFEQLDSQIMSKLAGQSVVLLTSTVVSPTTKQIIADFIGKTGGRHVQYDAVSYSGLLETYGRKIPAHNFDKADLVVSLGADFLGTWLSPVEFARAYSMKRKLDGDKKTMSKHYQFESYLSMTGSNADERFTHRPSETGLVALALLAAVGGGTTAPTIDAKLNTAIQKVANDLKTHRGAALVVCGSNDPNIQAVVREINRAVGAFGSTIDTGTTLNYRQGIDADMIALVQQMNAGQVGALLIYGANPAYDYVDAEGFKNGLKRVGLSVSFNEKFDETTELCQYVIPNHHYLESWGDAEPRTGYVSFIQPTIAPLFKTRAFQTSLLKWSGNNTDYETWFQNYWRGSFGSQAAFDKTLQLGFKGTPAKNLTVNNRSYLDASEQGLTTAASLTTLAKSTDSSARNTNGVAADTTQKNTAVQTTTGTQTPVVTTTGGTPVGSDLNAAITAISSTPRSNKNEIVLYQSVMLLSGKQGGNPWLLELPDPVTRATWDNYALISTAKAKELGIDYLSTEYEYYTEKPLIELTVGNKKVTIPALVIPGMDPNTIAVAVGYGRNQALNAAIYEDKGLGQNVYPFAQLRNNNRVYYNDVTTSAKTVGDYQIAQIQKHNSYEGRTEVLKETTLATFAKYPDNFKNWREELHKNYGGGGEQEFRSRGTMYTDPETRTHEIHWGMSIDLNSCIGCGACVVACHIENNVPIVGKNEVLRYHDMHWLRIDRYFVTEDENPDNLKTVIFQPMLCQHCDNAPCENVCPVAATMHSTEGLNQMAYNRCIGTRYCANNCPYKVRRFNWADYTGASTHGKLGPKGGVGKLNPVVHQMNDELTRMVLNPDVVTRSRGVMEKCTFCVQRTQGGKLQAKMENRPIGGDEVQTACAQACPTSAIVFGNAYDKTSTVAQIRKNNPQRLFYVLEQIHTLPNVNYLAKIRNTDEITAEAKMGEHASESKTEVIPSQNEPAKEGH
ncbi:MAG TPA: TAT-variant-translocated molybdopterin oxidoreductase [Flavisolibacter sp.]|nr:TAT-variant-translocated molybdopterin oxidoreductase [Flavisolibacter sp.]